MANWERLRKIGHLSVDDFLQDFWQQKHFVARQALDNFSCPISADELASLALEDDVASRLVIQNGPQSKMQSPSQENTNWSVEHGPLCESRFARLPDSHWTLLVQNVDALDERVNKLLNAFRFIPNWRLDDIMISYASDQGSVGPHFDYYDVFLLQASGKRKWKIGQPCTASTALLPNQAMKLLKSFQQQEEYLMQAGDILYLPPGLAHWGISEGESMTISIGFRAPGHADLLLETAHEVAANLQEDQRYRDAQVHQQDYSAEIYRGVIDQISRVLSRLTENPENLANIFGRMMTRINTDAEIEQNDTAHSPGTYPSSGGTQPRGRVQLSRFARAAWYRQDHEKVLCFINGESWTCSDQFAQSLCAYEEVDPGKLSDLDKRVILELQTRQLLEIVQATKTP